MKGYVSGVGDCRVIFQVAALYFDVVTESLMIIIVLLLLTASAVDVLPTLTLVLC